MANQKFPPTFNRGAFFLVRNTTLFVHIIVRNQEAADIKLWFVKRIGDFGLVKTEKEKTER